MLKKNVLHTQKAMEKSNKKSCRFSIIKNLANRRLGLNVNKSLLSYYTTLTALQNLKPRIALENSPSLFNTQISEIQFNSKGNLLANVFWGNDTVQIWDWSRARLIALFNSGHNFTVKQVNWIPANNDHLIVTSGQYGGIRLMDLSSCTSRLLGASYFAVEEFASGGIKFCVNINSPYTLLAGNHKGQIISVDIRERKRTHLLQAKHDNSTYYEIRSIDINPTKCYEFCVGGLEDIRIYDCRNLSNPIQKLSTVIEGCKNIYHSCRQRMLTAKYSYNGSEILAAFSEDPIYLFNTLRPEPIKTYSTKRQYRDQYSFTMYNVHFVGTRSELIVASSSMHSTVSDRSRLNSVYVWDKDSEDLVHEIQLEERSWRFAAHPYMPILAMNWDHTGIEVWQ